MKVEHLEALAALAGRAAADLAGPVAEYASLVRKTIAAGRTLFFAGNGGSAAHAQHIAAEYVVRYGPVRRKAVPALALSTDSSVVTATANDLGFDQIFARQIEAHAKKGDLLVLVSTSGKSANLLAAAKAAKAADVTVVALLGAGGGPLKALVDVAVVVPSDDTAHIQEIQLAVDHRVCSQVEQSL